MIGPNDGLFMFPSFRNPLSIIVPKRSSYSPSKLNEILEAFESALTDRLRQLKPMEQKKFLNLTWMQRAMEALSATYKDLKSLITDLQFPATDWDEKWMDEYLDDTVKLLDICIALNAEISKLQQAQLLIRFVLHLLEFSCDIPLPDKLINAKDSLQDFIKQTEATKTSRVSQKNSKIEHCTGIFQGLSKSLQLRKIKSSAKGKVLLRAMYGAKATTVFVCSVLASALSNCPGPLVDSRVPNQFLWSASFMSLQQQVNEEMRSGFAKGTVTLLKELESMNAEVKNMYSVIEMVSVDITKGMELELDQIKQAVLKLQASAELVAQGLEPLRIQVNEFFQVLSNGRRVLLHSLRLSGNQGSLMNE